MAAWTVSQARDQMRPIQGSKDAESSEEDDEGIPSHITKKRPENCLAGPSLRLPSTQLNPKRSFRTFNQDRPSSHLDTRNKSDFYPGSSKKRKLDNWTNVRGAHLPTPISSHPAHPVVDVQSQHESAGSSSEEDVPENVLAHLNSARNLPSHGEPEQHQHQQLPPTNRQPPHEPCQDKSHISKDEGRELENPDCAAKPQQSGPEKNVNSRETKDPSSEVRDNDGVALAPTGNIEYPPRSDGSMNKRIPADENPEDGQALTADPYEIPGSPEQPKGLKEPIIGTQSHTGRQDAQFIQQFTSADDEVGMSSKPLLRSSRIQSAAGRSQQAPGPRVRDHPPETIPEEDGDYHSERGEGNQDPSDDKYEESHPEAIDGLEAGEEEEGASIDLSAEDTFEQDVEHFRSLHAGTDSVMSFEGPPDNDLTVICLDYQPLRSACKLLTSRAWSGKRRIDWQWAPFKRGDAATSHGRILLSFLAKLERLYEAAPIAPKILEQNRFLREHSDLISYYFAKIEFAVHRIRTERLANPEHNTSTLNTDNMKRKEMARELKDIIIPMLLHVLASAWTLGGEKRTRTLFTSATTELLKKAAHWIMLLYRPFLRELHRSPLERWPKGNMYQRNKWREWQKKREELNDIMESLLKVLQDAPDMLQREEYRLAREQKDRERRLRKQAEIEAQRKLEEEARLRAKEEQRLRSVMSTRGIYYPLESSPPASHRRRYPTSSAPSFHRSSQWSLEEKVFLFKQIQESYPKLPNLMSLRVEIDKTIDEMEDMAEVLLERMLEAVGPDETAESRSAEVREIMQNYRLAYGR